MFVIVHSSELTRSLAAARVKSKKRYWNIFQTFHWQMQKRIFETRSSLAAGFQLIWVGTGGWKAFPNQPDNMQRILQPDNMHNPDLALKNPGHRCQGLCDSVSYVTLFWDNKTLSRIFGSLNIHILLYL